MAIYSSLVI